MSYEMIPVLEKLEEEIIASEIQAALDHVREMNTDVYGFGTAVHKGRVMDWSQAIDQWPVIFPQLPVDLTVECHIRAEGIIARAVEPKP
jgi:spore germination protein KC